MPIHPIDRNRRRRQSQVQEYYQANFPLRRVSETQASRELMNIAKLRDHDVHIAGNITTMEQMAIEEASVQYGHRLQDLAEANIPTARELVFTRPFEYNLVDEPFTEVTPNIGITLKPGEVWKFIPAFFSSGGQWVRDPDYPDRPEIQGRIMLWARLNGDNTRSRRRVGYALFPDPTRPGRITCKQATVQTERIVDGRVVLEYYPPREVYGAIPYRRNANQILDLVFQLVLENQDRIRATGRDQTFDLHSDEAVLQDLLYHAFPDMMFDRYACRLFWAIDPNDPTKWALRRNPNNYELKCVPLPADQGV